MTKITAIVPTFNRSAFLTESLASLAVQSRPVEEIIVWDDGSVDGTEAAARASPGPIRYFRSENGGKSRALNAALAEARGDLIWICDDDDLALPDAAERLTGLLDSAPGAGVAGGGYRRFRDDPKTGERRESGPGYWPDLSQGSVLRHLLEDIFLFQNASLVRKQLYDRTGPFRKDLKRSIDYDMIVRLALRAPIVMTDDALFLQRKHDGARGPAAARHRASDSDAVWKAADREIFADLRATIPLSLYSALFKGPTADRAGRLQRGCVYARRTDWAAAAEDFEAAAAIAPDVPLDPVEQAICRRAMTGKHGIAEALEISARRRMAHLAHASPRGAEIVRTLARGALWHGRTALRAGHPLRAASVARFVMALGGPIAQRSPNASSRITERRELPRDCWLD